jgi:hypothetical protein
MYSLCLSHDCSLGNLINIVEFILLSCNVTVPATAAAAAAAEWT